MNRHWNLTVGDAFEFVRNGKSIKQDRDAGGLPITRIETIADGQIDIERVGYAGVELVGNEQWLLREGDILFSHINSVQHVGKCAIYEGTPAQLIHGMNLLALRPSKNLHPRYALYALRQPAFRAQLLQFVNKAVNQASVSTTNLKSMPFSLPPLDAQRRIATILDKADALLQNRKRAIALLDSLTQSIFMEMFGDSALRGNAIASLPLSTLGRVHTGKTPPTARPELFVGEIPFITPGDLELWAGAAKRSISLEGAQFTKVVPSGSAMVCCIGATIGKMDMARTASAFNQQINAVEWSNKINPIYGLQALRQKRGEVISRSISTTLPILKKSEFEKIEILVPDIDLQRGFASRIESARSIEADQRHQYLKTEALFASLQHRAFSGQLYPRTP